jgi:hypothetical protein
MDTTGRRFYVLRSGSRAAPPDPVELQAMRAGPDGRLQLAGRYRWDPARGTLTNLRSKQSWVVGFDPQKGVLQAPASGVLEVRSEPPGAVCWVNGKRAGETPLRLTMRPGLAQVRVRWADGRERSKPVYVPPGDVGVAELTGGEGS